MLALILALSLGQPAGEWSTPREVSAVAHLDAAAILPFDRPFQRYVWIKDGRRESMAATNYALNVAANSSRVIQQATPVGANLLRLDCRLFDPSGKRLAPLWEQLIAEPDFHVDNPFARKVKVNPYRAGDGKTYDWQWQSSREFALHASPNDMLSLAALTGSQVPIVESRYLLSRMLTAIDLPGTPFRDGLYYDFVGIERKPAKGTARDAFLKRMGIDPDILTAAVPKSKVAVSYSKVTGKPRAVEFFYGTGVRPADIVPIVTFTLDIADGDIDPARHPIATLINAKFRASEAIGFTAAGLPLYALFDADGNLADSVPDDIARDGTIPFPFTSKLQPAIGCISCHADGEGWKPVANDVTALLAAGLRPLDDAGQADAITALDRILGEYTGDLTLPLSSLRNGHNALALQATGGMWLEKSAATAAVETKDLFFQYQYELIGPGEALRELGRPLLRPLAGQESPEARAVRSFNAVVLKLPAIQETGNIPAEDFRIGLLRAGVYIVRQDFNAVLPDLYLRSQATITQEPALPVKPKEEAKP